MELVYLPYWVLDFSTTFTDCLVWPLAPKEKMREIIELCCQMFNR